MTLHTAAHTAGLVEDAVSARLSAVALWALNGPGPLDVRQGVVFAPGSPMQVLGTSATSPWAVTVNPGHIVTTKGNSNGVYYSCNDALYTVNLSAPPASNSRIDTIYAMQQDSAAIVFPDGSTAAVIGAVTGTAGNGGLGASPTAPAVPTGAVALATVQIFSTATAGTSGANVTLTNLAWAWTVPRGTPIPVRTQAERDALNLYDGLQVYRIDLHQVEGYNGTNWGLPSTRAISTKITASVGSITGAADVAVVTSSAGVTGDGVKRFKITASFWCFNSSVANDGFDFKIKDQSTGATIATFRDQASSTAGLSAGGGSFVITDVPAVGSHIYQLTAIRTSGTGTGTVSASATAPAEILVEQSA